MMLKAITGLLTPHYFNSLQDIKSTEYGISKRDRRSGPDI